MDAKELLVKKGGQRQTVKRFHAGIIHSLRILDFTCRLGKTKQCPVGIQHLEEDIFMICGTFGKLDANMGINTSGILLHILSSVLFGRVK